jgi:hypothetical protein
MTKPPFHLSTQSNTIMNGSLRPFVYNNNGGTPNGNSNNVARNLVPLTNTEQYTSMNDYDADAWNMIHIFIGTNISKIDHMVDASMINNEFFYTTKWFSQLRQDYLVYQLLRKKQNGYFLDLAANDAIRISNTFALEYYHGWDGIVMEPNPIYWPALAYRNCTIVAAVVGQRTGQLMKFKFPKHSKPPPQGGLVGTTFDNHNNDDDKNNDEDVMRYTISLRDIFQKFHTPNVIDYFSLDIEGAETFVMESFPFDQYRFNVLTVERADERLCLLLKENGYVQMKQLKKWGETLWIHTLVLHDATIIDVSALDIDTENYKYRERILPEQHHHDISII